MAVDLTPSQSLIGAYAQGRAELETELKRRQDTKQQAKDNEFRQAQLDEQKRQHEEQMKQRDKEFDVSNKLQTATHELSKYIAGIQFQKQAEDTNQAPPGFEVDQQASPSSMYEVTPGVFEPNTTPYVNKDLGIKFNARSSAHTASDIAESERIAQQPKIDAERQLIMERASQERVTEQLKSDSTFDYQKALQSLEADQKINLENLRYAHDLDVVGLKGEAALRVQAAKSGQKSIETWTQFPLDPVAKERFASDHPEAKTWGDIFPNGELDVEGKQKFLTYANAERVINNVIPNLEKKYKLKNGTEISGYELYFKGAISGRQADIMQELDSKAVPEVENIRKDLGRVFLLMKNDANLGAVLSETEKKLLETYIAGTDRKMTVTRAIAIIPDMLNALREERINTVITHGKERPNANVTGFSVLPE